MLNLSPEARQKLSGRDIICISSMAYATMWTRKQRLMTILAEMGNRVLYVEPSWPMFTKGGDRGEFTTRISEVKPDLWVLTPRGRLPLARFALLKKLNLWLYGRSICAVASILHFKRPILFTYTPVIHAHSDMIELERMIEHTLLIYDCVDEHSETIGYDEHWKKLVQKMDLSLTRRADVVFVTAQGLYNDRKDLNPNLYWSPNGADVAHFSKATQQETKIPDDLAAIPGPRVGFVGALSDWIDYPLIAQIAKAYPQYSVVLVGPLKRGLKPAELETLPNVHFLGRKPLDHLPGYLKGFACGINPFQDVGIAKKVNPLKVYEYLAARLPVVSTDMPEVLPLEGVVRIARGRDDFVAGVGEAVSGKFKPDSVRLEETIRRHNWDLIFCELLEKVAAKLT
jgi:glycosyltransferase involved in cell wall biosynthesis